MRIILASLFLFSFLWASPIDPDMVVTVDESYNTVCKFVNVLTGNFCINRHDLTVNGHEPISLIRSYANSDTLEYDGGWTFFPHLTMTLDMSGPGARAYIAEPSGALIKYSIGGKLKLEEQETLLPNISEKSVGFRNSSLKELSARTNLKNNKLELKFSAFKKRRKKKKKKKLFIAIKATLSLGDGSQRIYTSTDLKGTRSVFIPIYMRLQTEIKPNGNLIHYKYDSSHRLSSIKTTNPSNTKTYASINFDYVWKKEKNHDFTATTSDKKKVSYHYWRPEKEYLHDFFYLTSVSGTGIVSENWSYEMGYLRKPRKKKNHKIRSKSRGPFANTLQLGGKKRMCIEYYRPKDNPLAEESIYIASAKDPRCERVKIIQEPLGDEGKFIPTHLFEYTTGKREGAGFDRPGHTHLYDLDGNSFHYHFSGKLRFDAIDYHYAVRGQKKYCYGEKFYWGSDKNATRLMLKAFIDPQKTCSSARQFSYDPKGNVLKESLYGNLSGQGHSNIEINNQKVIENNIESYSKKYEYSQDRFNLPTKKEEDNGRVTLCTYKPNTDLITSKLIGSKDKILIRHFYEYNEDNILIKEIMDDGTEKDLHDLSSVEIRKIKIIHPKKEQPALNFPEIVEEKYYDKEKGEMLLSKKVYHYSERGEVIKEDIYDSNDTFQYSLHTKYNDAGQIIEQTNPLGQVSTYEYDDCHNLILYKEAGLQIINKLHYDEAHRLICKEEQAPGEEVRTLSYTYDTKGNKTSETDYQKNATYYLYDGRGKLLEKQHSPTIKDGLLVHATILYEYDAKGREIFRKDPNGHITKTSYNAYDKPTKITHPDGSEEKFIYNLDGTLKEHIDQEGTITSYTYDVLGRELTKTIRSSRGDILSEESKNYNGFEIASYTDAEGNVTYYFYDGAGRKIAEEFHMKTKIERTEYLYDSLGKLHTTKICNENNSILHITEKDLLDRDIEERTEDTAGKIYSRVLYEYDDAGNKSLETHFIDNQTSTSRYFYDPFNRLIKKIDPLQNESTITYLDHYLNACNQHVLKKIDIDPMGIETIEIYDTHDNVVSTEKRNSQGATLSYEEFFYDKEENLERQLSTIIAYDNSTRKVETHWQYDSMNRLERLIEAWQTKDERITCYNYTAKGQLKQTIKPDGIILENSYDPLGRATTLTSSDNSCHYSYKYNKLGHLIESVDHNTRLKITRQVDGKGRILKETLPNNFTIEKCYDLADNPTQLILPDNSSIEKTYEGTYLKSVTRKDKNNHILYTHKYTNYDLDGNLLTEELIGNLGEVRYTQDLYGRLSSVYSKYFQNKIEKCDKVGRIKKLSWNNSASQYDYDDLGQLTRETGLFNKNYSYDSHYNELIQEELN